MARSYIHLCGSQNIDELELSLGNLNHLLDQTGSDLVLDVLDPVSLSALPSLGPAMITYC
jgi:hypothetical protein